MHSQKTQIILIIQEHEQDQPMEMNIGGNKSAFHLYCLHHCLAQKMVKQECCLGQSNMNIIQKDVQAYLDQDFFRNQYAQGYLYGYSLSDLFALQRQSSICKTQYFETDQKIIKQQIIQQCPIEKPKSRSRISLQKNILPSIRYAIINLLKKAKLLSMRNTNVNRFIRGQNTKMNRQIFSQLFSVQEFRYEVSKLMLNKKLSRQLMLSKKLSKNMANQMALFKKALKRGYF